MCSNIAFAYGFLTVVGLCFIPYGSHRCSKCNLNSDPLSWISTQSGFTYCFAILLELLSKISSDFSSSLPLMFIVHSLLTKGSSTISNQLEVEYIMVRAIKFICELSLPLIVYRPIRSTHKHSQGMLMTSLARGCLYFLHCLLLIWHFLQDFVSDRIVVCIPFQYIAAFIISSRRVCPGCCI